MIPALWSWLYFFILLCFSYLRRKKIIENKVKEIYICLDKDAQKQAIEHAEEFMSNGINVYFVDLAQKDPAEIGFEKMIQIINEDNYI